MWVRSVVFLWMVVFLTAPYPAFNQDIGIDTAAIRELIYEWNFANNTQSVESFNNVYAERLMFYTKVLSEEQAIALKKELFASKPGFRQNVAGAIRYTAYTGGVVKCDFLKEIWERAQWRELPSYLLVSYNQQQYEIVGESDHPTDQAMGYELSLGEEMAFQPIESTGIEDDKSKPDSGNRALFDTDSLEKVVSENLEALLSALPEGTVVVQKSYVYMFMGFILLGGLMIVIADAAYWRKRRRRRVRVVKKRDVADEMVAELNTQSVFEAFVITLFDPIFFRHKRPETEKVYAGHHGEGQSGPDLEFVYSNKSFTGKFAVKCLYFRNAIARRWQLMPPDQLRALREFQAEADLYYVLGIGGTPDDPRELYLVPSTAVTGTFVTRDSLRPYAKSGMFYYNRKINMLR